MQTKWQNHLQKVQRRNPNKTLKECMELASVSYRAKEKETKSIRSTVNQSHQIYQSQQSQQNCKFILKDTINICKDLQNDHDKIHKSDVQKLKKARQVLSKILADLNEESSSSDSDSESCSD